MVFAYFYCGGPLLGVVLVDMRKYKPLLFNIYLFYNACILGGFSRCFFRVLLVGFSLFRPGTARAPFLAIFSINKYKELNSGKINRYIK